LDTFIKHFPKKFIEKEKGIVPKKVFGNRFGMPDKPVYEGDVIHPDEYIDTQYRPWERGAKEYNRAALAYRAQMKRRERGMMVHPPLVKPDVKPLPDEKWFWFRGDRVQVLIGKNKGRQGIILSVVRERNWIFVEGLHCKYQYQRPPGLSPILSMVEQPLLVPDEAQLVDPKDLRPTEVEWRWNEQGERVRVSLRTGYTLPMPSAAVETYDYKTPEAYKENEAKDTKKDDALEQTYEPKLATFEDELKEMYGISDTRPYGRTYWY